MTAKEKKAYEKWNREMTQKADERDYQFKLMQSLFEEKGGGKASCSLEHNLFYLLSSSDEQTRGRALTIYRKYFEADAQYMAMCDLAQAFANI